MTSRAVLDALPYAAAIVAARRRSRGAIEIRPLETEDELRDFVSQAFGVTIPDVQVCPEHSTPWRAFSDAYFAPKPGDVWKASRGLGGKSFLLSTLAATEALTLAIDVNVLGGSGEQSKRVLEAMGSLWAYPQAPRYMLKGDPLKAETRLTNNATIRALLASQASVRGPHPVRLRLDEVDEMDRELFDAATGQPMSARNVPSHIVASSTEQYVDGTMAQVKEFAAGAGWGYHEWCYRETLAPHGWLSVEEKDRRRSQVPLESWNREFEGQLPDPSAYAIDREAIERMFRADLGVFDGTSGEYIECEPPIDGARYAHGGDWAKERDWTDIWTIRTDQSPVRLVAYQRTQKQPWPAMTALLDERIRRYRGPAKHDATGVGDVVDDLLREPAEGVWFGGHDRAEILSEYIVAIESGEIVAPRIKAIYDEHRKCTRRHLTNLLHLPDSICAGSLAWSAGKKNKPVRASDFHTTAGPSDAERFDW